jgi:hypothetical protein
VHRRAGAGAVGDDENAMGHDVILPYAGVRETRATEFPEP